MGIVFVFAGAGSLLKSFSEFKRRQLIQNTPTSTARSVAMGLVEVQGKIVPSLKKLRISPFTGKECVYFRYTIEEYRKSGKSSKWVTIRKEEIGDPFFVEDKTGRVLVDPYKADVSVETETEFESGLGKAPPQQVAEYCKASNVDIGGIVVIPILGKQAMYKPMRFREYILPPGEEVFVLGTAMDNPDVEEGTAVEGSQDVVIARGEGKLPFYISTRSEKEAMAHLSKGIIFLFLLGLGLLLLGLAILFYKLGLF
jgi:hypothetical protein